MNQSVNIINTTFRKPLRVCSSKQSFFLRANQYTSLSSSRVMMPFIAFLLQKRITHHSTKMTTNSYFIIITSHYNWGLDFVYHFVAYFKHPFQLSSALVYLAYCIGSKCKEPPQIENSFSLIVLGANFKIYCKLSFARCVLFWFQI